MLRVLGAARDGRYIGLSAHSVGTDVSSDAYDYFHGLMARFGRYPLDLGELEREARLLDGSAPAGFDPGEGSVVPL